MNDDAHEKPLGLPDGILRLVPYRSEWPNCYEQDAARIRQSVPSDVAVKVHHIGSTAVEGVAAKPILDTALIAKTEEETQLVDALEGLGYVDRGDRSGRHFMLEDGKGVRALNLYLCAPDDDRMTKQIASRDASRRNPQAHGEHMNIKANLLGGARQEYAPGKKDFTTALLAT